MNKRIRATYPAEFKLEAVGCAKAGDRSVRSLEAELGLTPNLLRQWVLAYDAKGENAFVRKSLSGEKQGGEDEAAEQVRQLQQRVLRLEEERTILKKALKLLSQDL